MGKIYRGRRPELEDEADRMLRESLKGVYKHSEKSDLLTPWKQKARYAKEVYVASGTPDKAIRQGMFNRVYNPAQPHLNSRLGAVGPRRAATQSLSDFVTEHGADVDA